MEFLIILGAGAILAAIGFGLLKREQRRSTRRVLILARLANADNVTDRAAGYYPGSLSDPRD